MNLTDGMKNLVELLKIRPIQQMAGDDLKSIVASALTDDPAGTAAAIKKTITNVAHLPTYLFWNKMERFLRGTFRNFDDQIRMSSRFDSTNDDYANFTLKLVSILNQIEIDDKVDYYANLTRAFLLGLVDEELFFKLAKFILQCTLDELQYLQCVDYNYASENSLIISSLFQYGLMEQGDSVNRERRYKLSDFAKALKQNCLNIDNESHGVKHIGAYKDMKPPILPSKAVTWDDF